MEKKTIGGFISALRRAKGLTQRELAELLNVSDKAVSRWERDECAPDLLLIPVIADIFGVTSDEILRGERRISEERSAEPETYGERSEKALKAILARKKSSFSSKLMICYCMVALGVLLAMCFNFALNKAALGFFIGCAFFIGAVFVLVLSYKMLFLETDDLPEGPTSDFKRYVIKNMRNGVAVIIAAFVLILPYLVVTIMYGAYVGLAFFPWLLYGGIGALVAFAVCKIVFTFKTVSDIEKGKYSVTDTELSAYRSRNRKLTKFLKKEALATVAIIVELAVLWTVMIQFDFFAKRSFDSFDEAQAYIYKANYNFSGLPSVDVEFKVESFENEASDENISGHSADISEDVIVWDIEFKDTHIFFKKNGVVVEELVDTQKAVYRLEAGFGDSGLPIALWTHYARYQGQTVAYILTAVMALIYVVLSFIIYLDEFIKRKNGG